MPIKSLMHVLFGCLFAATSLAQPAGVRATNDESVAVRELERVCLSEVLIRTSESDSSAQITEARSKAEQVRTAFRLGGAFADLASANSQGPTAAKGGAIGCFKRGQLAKRFDELVFRMKVGEISEVLRTKQGSVILQVTEGEPESPPEIPEQAVQDPHASGIKGKVVAKVANGEQWPIQDVYVLVHPRAGIDMHARTDKNGKYSVPLPPGIYDVFVSAEMFSPTSLKVEVTPVGMMVFNPVLEVNSLGMDHLN